MRRVFCAALLVLGLASPAVADDDYPFLRSALTVGPATFTKWSGFYFGGQLGYGETNVDFSSATQPLVAYSLRDTTLEDVVSPSQYQVLGRSADNTVGYGGFVGYNTQWQDLMLGVEGNYTRTSFDTTSPVTTISRVTSTGSSTYSVNITGTGNLQLTDYASLRARAGPIVGDLLPYGFAGIVVGRGSYNVTSLVSGQQNPSSPPVVPCDLVVSPTCVDYSFANSGSLSNALLYGFSLGGGLDWALTPNIFLRGEFEFIQFAPIANINVSIVGARVGAGFKF
ncbi:MAG: outer membrane beta-barrel protein [Xanthobacteraceae bacterium]|jgi:opacity protein-like surface antigen